jgi:streptomycin 6-kinase
MDIPAALEWLRDREDGRRWLDALPGRVAACADHWGLSSGDPYPDSHVSLVVPVSLGSERLVLKLQFPHDESEHEADALRLWAGDAAIRLVDHWPEHGALLLERCEPGHHLSTIDPEDALEVMAGIVERLSVPAGEPFTRLGDEARGWAERLPARWHQAGRPFERRLLDAAVGLLKSLSGEASVEVLLHQDLHGDNVLAADREPWLAIDPKPLVGDPAFAPAPIIRSYEFGHSRAAVLRRLDLLTERLALDRDRVMGWAIGQTVAWSIEGRVALERHVQTATWLLESV